MDTKLSLTLKAWQQENAELQDKLNSLEGAIPAYTPKPCDCIVKVDWGYRVECECGSIDSACEAARWAERIEIIERFDALRGEGGVMDLIEALKNQHQVDHDGVFVGVSRQAVEGAITEIGRLRAENEALRKCCTQRGARMQIMRDWINRHPQWIPWTNWDSFISDRPEVAAWFDADGVPVEEAALRGEGEK